MSGFDTQALIASDKRHSWHPFTQMRDWCAPDHEPLVLVSGDAALLRDSEGREYIDGNSSIWTNIHGHNHPAINAAIRAQLGRVAHTSFLGFTNPQAIALAEELVKIAPGAVAGDVSPNCSRGLRPRWVGASDAVPGSQTPATAQPALTRVFLSDDGSTAIEVALKIAAQFWQLTGQPQRARFVAFTGAYHGDTMGASSLGGVKAFHERFAAWQFPVDHVSSIEELDALFDAINPKSEIRNPKYLAAVVIEPLIQGAAGMRLWPARMLARLRAWCDAHDVLLIADEVMTGFGRTGTMFACEQECVVPDFLCVAKGITGGYLPLAATLTTQRVFDAFLGGYEEMKTLFYGHSYTGNQLACAAALASLRIFREENVLAALQPKIARMRELGAGLKLNRFVADVRQCGFVMGIEVAQTGGEPFDWRAQTGARICEAARRHGLLTRPIRDTVVLVPPYCITDAQLAQAFEAINEAINEICSETQVI